MNPTQKPFSLTGVSLNKASSYQFYIFMKTRALWMGLSLLLVTLRGYGADAPDPATLLRGVQAVREQVPPSRLSLKTVFKSPLNYNEFGATVVFDGDLRCFVRSNASPTRAEFIRAVFDGTEVLLYDNNYVSIYNISGDGPGDLYDPRVLGLSGTLTWEKTIKQCLSYEFSSELEIIGQEEIEGASTWHIRRSRADGAQFDWWIDLQHSFRVIRYDEKWQFGSRSVQSWYQHLDYKWLPSRVIVEEFGGNRGLVSRTETTVLEANANIHNEGRWGRVWTYDIRLAGSHQPLQELRLVPQPVIPRGQFRLW